MRGSMIGVCLANAMLGLAALASGPTYGNEAQISGDSVGAPQPSPTSAGGTETSLEEVVVTAEKRSEKLLDVPASVSALSGDHLTLLQSKSLADMASYIPGLTVQNGGSPGENVLVIRGLSTGYNSISSPALVGTYIDGMQMGSSTAGTRGAVFGLDLMPYDVAQVEVLRGPQGTLYGGDAMAGLVKYELRKPQLTRFEAQVGTGVEDISGGGSPGRGGRAAINMPIVSGLLGLRLSGFHQDTAGYIDNVGIGVKDSNHSTESGGRATLLWQPQDGLSVQLTALGQNIVSAGPTAVTVNEATLQPVYGDDSRLTLLAEPYTQQMRAYDLDIAWNLGFATLNSNSSWQRFNNIARYDLSPNFGKYIPGVANALVDEHLSDDFSKFTQEVRLASSGDQRISWILGGYYTHESGQQVENVPTFTSGDVPLPATDNLLYDATSYVYQEVAAFANLTYKITERFDVSAGDRYSTNKQTGCTDPTTGLFGGVAGSCSGRPSQDVSTWMTNARFHVDRDTMLYARVATGYRPGGGCDTCGNPKLGTPNFFYADRTTNYEAGFKSEAFSHRLQIDTSIFYIDWTNIQLQQITSKGILYTGNGGTASSSGIELTTSYRLTADLRLTGTLDHTDAHLTEDAPGAGGRTGDQLPNSPRWSGSVIADYIRDISDSSSFIAGGGYRYRDAVVSQFAGTGNPEPMRPQNIVDAYAGLQLQHVTLRLYGKNIFNNQSYTGLYYLTNPKLPQFVPVEPRTIGLSVDYKY